MTGKMLDPLIVHHYPCVGIAQDLGPLVLIHGWGSDSRTWQPVLAQLQEFATVITVDLPGFGVNSARENLSLTQTLELLESQLPSSSTLIGWSLGGMLAVALAVHRPDKIKRVMTLAANLRFVTAVDYITAMPAEIYTQFVEHFGTDPQHTLKRFLGLVAQGDVSERRLLKALRSQADAQPNAQWQQTLAWLGELDNRQNFSRLQQPGLHLFGDTDALVPVAAAGVLAAQNPRQQIKILPGVAHALHWSQPEKVVQLIKEFLEQASLEEIAFDKNSSEEISVKKISAQTSVQISTQASKKIAIKIPALDKRKVAQSFSRAAATYDGAADLQRQVGEQLLQHLPQCEAFQWILDLGCGTGFFSQKLVDQFPQATVVGVDIAEGMLRHARDRVTEQACWVGGDGECLPLRDHCADVIFSSLAIQWCEQLPQLFTELWRVLKPGGQLLFSTLGPNTLHELKTAWQTIDGYVHVNRFQSAQTIKTTASAAGFFVSGWQVEKRVLTFTVLEDLMRELKALGAHNVNAGQDKGLTGRRKLLKLKEAYEIFRCEKKLPATYEVFYGVLQKEDTKKDTLKLMPGNSN